jgi:hypothetical protein
MSCTRHFVLSLGAALSLAPLPSLADESIGRTGLPTVVEGKNQVWFQSEVAKLEVRGNELWVTQDVKMQYPGRDLEKEPTRIKVAVREDYYRSKADGGADENNAKGFKSFAVSVDGSRAKVDRDPWTLNHNKDTATRWRSWWIGFQPGQTRKMRIVSVAPLGWQGNRRIVEFTSKDVGKWRGSPTYLEIRFMAPGKIEATLAGLEPKPNDQTRKGIRWVYRKASPNRDIFIMLPSTYPKAPKAS